MNTKTMDRIKEIMCNELDEMMSSGKYNIQEIHMITDTIKNIDKIKAMDEGYSEAMMPMSDSYGRYSMRGNYSNRSRYSSAKDEIADHIQERLNDSSLSYGERESLRRAMDSMR